MAYLDNNGVLYLWGKIKAWVKGQGYITSADVPEGAAASTTTPKMDGTAAVGSETAFARGDHVHPSDTSKVDTISGFGLAKISDNEGNFTISVQEGSNAAKNANVVSSTTFHSTMQQANQALAAKANADDVYTKAYLDKNLPLLYARKSDIASMYKYKGSVATVSDLPSSDNTTGDVYNVESTGMNYAWNGTAWDALGESFQITAITNAELDAVCT